MHIINITYHLAKVMFIRFLHYKVTFFSFFIKLFFGRVSLSIALNLTGEERIKAHLLEGKVSI